MIKIVLASNNPVKIQAVKNGFQKMFPGEKFEIVAAAVKSGVSDQPISETETLQGAMNRADRANRAIPSADFWIGIEGGIQNDKDGTAAYAWIVVKSNDLVGKSRTGTFYLPQIVSKLLNDGLELGEADDIVFQQTDSKRKNGAIGILTGNVITRSELYEHAVILALVPFKNRKLYTQNQAE